MQGLFVRGALDKQAHIQVVNIISVFTQISRSTKLAKLPSGEASLSRQGHLCFQRGPG